MRDMLTRREALQSAGALGAALGLADLGFLRHLPPVSAAEAQLDPKVVRFDESIEPLVRLLEETPRERLLEEVGQRVKQGLAYRDLLAALLLAGVRNVEPRPQVGFKFHAVLVVNSAHLASLASPDEHRWLPIFWALDEYKSAEAQDTKERNWTMGPVQESAVPPAPRARQAFVEAMDAWDEPAADAAIAGLSRGAGAGEIFELFCRYGARDLRAIGHKAIFVANSWRTLAAIGWQHREPILRSLAYALLMHEEGNPRDRDDEADRPFRQNQTRVARMRPDWLAGQVDEAATRELLEALRTDSAEAACDHVVELINRGVAPQSAWDALFLAAGELLLKQPGIISLHAVTTTNALRYAFDACALDETRRLLLLQNAAFIAMFRQRLPSRGQVADIKLNELSPLVLDASSDGVEQILADIGRDSLTAARKTLTVCGGTDRNERLMDAARLLVFFKGNDAHDYKFSSAVLEDYYRVSPRWRHLYLAANVAKLRGSHEPDNALVQRIRAALTS